MLIQLMKKNVKRNKTITIILFVFLLLSSLFTTSGSTIIIMLIQAVNSLTIEAKAPDYVQMHSGELEETELRQWANNLEIDHLYQTVEMITVEGSSLFIGDNRQSEVNSVMDISFVKQNRDFDFLLDMDNQIAYPAVGEIGVPVFYMLRDQLKLGDKITLQHPNATLEWTISHFIRDALMNPAIIHSKRFLINDTDYQSLANLVDNREYLIEFQTDNVRDLQTFIQAYQKASLPEQGPAIDKQAFQLLNSVTEGLVAVVLLFISFILILIALVCIRLTISATLEEDYYEIGVMKAIGVTPRQIKFMYLGKYLLIAIIAGIVGFLIAKMFEHVIIGRITSYFGSVPTNWLNVTVSLSGVVLVMLIVFLFCYRTLSKIDHINAVTAIKNGKTKQLNRSISLFSMQKKMKLPLSLIMAVKDFFTTFKMNLFFLIVMLACTFLLAVPILLYQTIKSPNFISYMGIGKGDIRIDVPFTTDEAEYFHQIIQHLEADEEVIDYVPLTSYSFQTVNGDGETEKITVDSGDVARFSLSYTEGVAPMKETEIALSYLYSKDFDKNVGDQFVLMDNGRSTIMTVTGIYQDITNGGRTAKAVLDRPKQRPLHYVINVFIRGDVGNKWSQFEQLFPKAKITHLEGYKQETLGDMLNLIRTISWLTFTIVVVLTVLIVSLFIKLFLARKLGEIMILQSIGFSRKSLQNYYFQFFSVMSIVAILIGLLIAFLIGEMAVSFIWSFFGAAKISFEQDAIQLLIYPILFVILSILVTIRLGVDTLKPFSVKEWRD